METAILQYMVAHVDTQAERKTDRQKRRQTVNSFYMVAHVNKFTVHGNPCKLTDKQADRQIDRPGNPYAGLYTVTHVN